MMMLVVEDVFGSVPVELSRGALDGAPHAPPRVTITVS